MKLARLMDALDAAVENWPVGVRSYVRRFAEQGASEKVGADWLETTERALDALLPALDGELHDEAAQLLDDVRAKRGLLPKSRKKRARK
jgi:hypothetical protein